MMGGGEAGERSFWCPQCHGPQPLGLCARGSDEGRITAPGTAAPCGDGQQFPVWPACCLLLCTLGFLYCPSRAKQPPSPERTTRLGTHTNGPIWYRLHAPLLLHRSAASACVCTRDQAGAGGGAERRRETHPFRLPACCACTVTPAVPRQGDTPGPPVASIHGYACASSVALRRAGPQASGAPALLSVMHSIC